MSNEKYSLYLHCQKHFVKQLKYKEAMKHLAIAALVFMLATLSATAAKIDTVSVWRHTDKVCTVKYYVNGDTLFTDKKFFGDNKEHEYFCRCHDGFALCISSVYSNAPDVIKVKYPKLKELTK